MPGFIVAVDVDVDDDIVEEVVETDADVDEVDCANAIAVRRERRRLRDVGSSILRKHSAQMDRAIGKAQGEGKDMQHDRDDEGEGKDKRGRDRIDIILVLLGDLLQLQVSLQYLELAGRSSLALDSGLGIGLRHRRRAVPNHSSIVTIDQSGYPVRKWAAFTSCVVD